jgi:uncharacterized protein YukE
VEEPPLIYREEVRAIMEALADISWNVQRIADALEEDDGEEDEEADS